MKELVVLIALTALSCMASSQNLTPKVQQQDKDTLFCFTLDQSRSLAKYLEQGRYCDSLLTKSETQIQQLYELQAANDSCMAKLNEKTENQQRMLTNQRTEISGLNLKLGQSDKACRKERWQKYLFLVSTVVLGTCLIIK